MIPKCVRYSSIKPKGFSTKMKRWKLNPQSSFNSFNKNELVRFVIDSDGFVDPYRIYVDVTISTTSQLMVNPGVLMLDGPSTSIFQSLQIYSNSKLIERIDEYDQLGNILRDLQYAPLIEANRQYEGYGFERIANNSQLGDHALNTQSATFYNTTDQRNQTLTARFRPYNHKPNFINKPNNFVGNTAGTTAMDILNQQAYTYALSKKQRFDLSYQELDGEFGIDVGNTNIQGEGNLTIPDTTQTVDQAGHLIPFSQSLSRGKGQYLCPVGVKAKLVNGQFLRTTNGAPAIGGKSNLEFHEKYEATRLRLIVPLLSGCLGILIPKDQWKLLPMQAFRQLMFEFKINPYAFFSAGYATHLESSLMLAEWKVENIQMVFDIWYYDQNVTSTINQALNGEGIIISSQSASLGPMYNIIANGTVTNNWQINNGIESTKSLFFWFLDNAYQRYPFLRKNFRLSQNVRSVQLKVGPDFIPPYPIEGHAGNVVLNQDLSTVDGDNTEFIIELQKCFNKLFDVDDNISMDKLNFAINERSHFNNYQSAQYGCALFEEMRCVGKALFAINLDQNPYDAEVLSGLDTTKQRPIELIIKGTDANKFNGDSTMYILLWHDFYVQLTNNGVMTYGQG